MEKKIKNKIKRIRKVKSTAFNFWHSCSDKIYLAYFLELVPEIADKYI